MFVDLQKESVYIVYSIGLYWLTNQYRLLALIRLGFKDKHMDNGYSGRHKFLGTDQDTLEYRQSAFQPHKLGAMRSVLRSHTFLATFLY